MNELNESIVRLEKNMVNIMQILKEMKTEIIQLKNQIVELRNDVNQLKNDVAQLKKEQKEMKADILELKVNQKEMQNIIKDMHKNMIAMEIRQDKNLAEFRKEVNRKFDTLSKTDNKIKTMLKNHYTEIKSELFSHSIRIKNLEEKVIGA